MDLYKRYTYKLREMTLKEPYISVLNEDISPQLKLYIHELNSITFDDGAYHTYYGGIKTVVNSYNIYWTDMMDVAIKEADKCSHCVTLAELTEMTHKTITMHKEMQTDFESEFLPLHTPLEEQAYKEIIEKYNPFMKDFEKFLLSLKWLDKQDKVDEFTKEHFPISLKRHNDMFVFTYNFISNELSLAVNKIRVSIEEIYNRMRMNMHKIHEQSDSCVSDLLIQLYEKNKEHLHLSRQDTRSSVQIAEVQRSMDIIKDKIGDSKQLPIQCLQEELKYWESRICEFENIHRSIIKLQEEESLVLEQENLFNSMKDSSIPAPKLKCWEHMGEKFKKKLQEINELKLNAAKSLQTFFSVRGADRIFYSDNIGRYYVDELGHQCYVYNYGLCVYHVNCRGEFVAVPDKEKYLYDSLGRFYIDNNTGEKLYQVAPCSSCYKIEKDVYVKHTKDCGHSEKCNKHCRMLMQETTDTIILPPIEPVDIQGKLPAETVRYLWDTFGHILPEVLHDVAEARPKNPIHCLAHKLLAYKYRRTDKETELKKKEADLYRSGIYQDRLEKASATYKAWKKKQNRARKTDEIDDSEEKMAFNSYVALQDFVQTILNYDNN